MQQRIRGNLTVNPALFMLEVAYKKAINMGAAPKETNEKDLNVKIKKSEGSKCDNARKVYKVKLLEKDDEQVPTPLNHT
jgi:hypothetical protein